MSEPHWATGPAEILRHGFSLLSEDTDTNRRLAMINIDNAVELMMQTYIHLPRRVTAIAISRNAREQFSANFPSLLDGIEEHAPEKLIGIDLGLVEWFHRLRNELYHQGNGLTVERAKVEAYSEIAAKLFEGLFGESLKVSSSKAGDRLGEFLEAWIRIEGAIIGQNTLRAGSIMRHAEEMLESLPDGPKLYDELVELRQIRNTVVHGETDISKALSEKRLNSAKFIASRLENIREEQKRE